MAPSKVPKFGDWEAEESAGYTVRFDTVRKGKPGGPIINPNDPQANQVALPSASDAPHQTKAKPKQPGFGDWDEEEEVPYTQYFENHGKVKTAPSEPQINYNAVPTQPRKTTPNVVKANETLPRQGNTNTRSDDPYRSNGGRGMNSSDPRAKPEGVKFVDRESSAKQSPLHPGAAGRGRSAAPLDNNRGAPVGRQRIHATTGPSPGRGGASVPVFGGWEDNPSQADGYTVMFKTLQDERNGITPVDMNSNHPRYGHPTNQQQKQGGCFSCLFG